MASLILYYSLSGQTRRIAEQHAAQEDAALVEIKETRKRGMFRAFFPGVFESRGLKASSIEPLGVDLSAYDKITLMAPVWGGHAAPAINAVADLLPAGAKVAVVLASGSGKSMIDKLSQRLCDKGCEVTSAETIATGDSSAKI